MESGACDTGILGFEWAPIYFMFSVIFYCSHQYYLSNHSRQYTSASPAVSSGFSGGEAASTMSRFAWYWTRVP
jgi:hypothetical protein